MRKVLFCACLLAVVGPKAYSEDTLADAKVTPMRLKTLLEKAEAAERLRTKRRRSRPVTPPKFDLALQGGRIARPHFEVAVFGGAGVWRGS